MVLADLRAGAKALVAAEVSVRNALVLFEEGVLSVSAGIELGGAAVDAGLALDLLETRCVAADDGSFHHPLTPGFASVLMLASRDTQPREPGNTLAERLGIAVRLHSEYRSDTPATRAVLSLLRKRKCLITDDDETLVLERLGELGVGGATLGGREGTSDAQLHTLQEAFASVPDSRRKKLGSRIGPALSLRGFQYDPDGTRKDQQVAPSEAYLPAALDTVDRGFGTAAKAAPNLLWLHGSYAGVLSTAGINGGPGRADFLRMLGVADAPRTAPAVGLDRRYVNDQRLGLPEGTEYGSASRGRTLRAMRADHTLDDRDSPHLLAVVEAIAADPDAQSRRRRTVALIRTLDRAGMVGTRRAPTVIAALAYRTWQHCGRIPPLWVWKLRAFAWLERADGSLGAPESMHLPTDASRALYGTEDPGYLHPDIYEAVRTRAGTLAGLGLVGEPDTKGLVERLRELSSRTPRGRRIGDDVTSDAVAVYQAMAARLRGATGGQQRQDFVRDLKAAFPKHEALILTDTGWHRIDAVMRGASILHGYRPFVLPHAELRPLWAAIGIREPTPDDFATVLKEVALDEQGDEAERVGITLESLRRLAALVAQTPQEIGVGLRTKLRTLPLYTRGGWVRERPVYAVDNRYLATALADHARVWDPGGDLEQFASLLKYLHVTRVETVTAEVLNSELAYVEPALSEAHRRAVLRLQDHLVRNEPRAVAAFTEWKWLADLEVRVMPGLRIRLSFGDSRPTIDVEIEAHLDDASGILFLASAQSLQTTKGAGQAIAARFTNQRARVGHAWRDVWENHEPTLGVAPLISAHQRDHDRRQQMAALAGARVVALHGTAANPLSSGGGGSKSAGGSGQKVDSTATLRPSSHDAALPAPRPTRTLVDSDMLYGQEPTLRRRSPQRAANSSTRVSPRNSRPAGGGLPAPRSGGAPLRQHTGPTGYTDQEREAVALRLLQFIVERDGVTLEDQRGALGLGADAVDSLGRFYEIKAHAGREPAEVSLTGSELQRAYLERDRFVLVIASNLEEGMGAPRLRMIADPLLHLGIESAERVRVTGLDTSDDVANVYEWPSSGEPTSD